jgi:hypothetical protein
MLAIFLSQNPKRTNLLEDHGVDRKIFKHVYKKQGGIMYTGLTCLGHGPVVSYCEHRNEPSSFIHGTEFLEYRVYSQFI